MKLIKYLILFIFYSHTWAQINRDVIVIKPYEPTLSDVQKISDLPILDDSVNITPEFNYFIYPKHIETSFDIRPIKPAKMVPAPLTKFYKHYINIGGGNYATPMVEYNFNTLRSKEHSLGAYFYHKSSHTNLKLENNDRVPAGYSINNLHLYGKQFYNSSELFGNFNYNRNGLRYYGYNTSLYQDSLPYIKSKDIKQSYLKLGGQAGIRSSYIDSSKLHYLFKAKYTNFSDKFENKETNLLLNLQLKKIFGKMALSVNVNYTNVQGNNDSLTSTMQFLNFAPSFMQQTSEYRVFLGLNSYIDLNNNSKLYYYPEASLQITLVENVLVPYLGISGNIENYSYMKLTDYNPYLFPEVKHNIVENELKLYAGVFGNLSSKAGFKFNVSYSRLNNRHFYINDTLSDLQNHFDLVYDDVELIKYYWEINFDPLEKLNFLIKGNIYNYTTSGEEKAWHTPLYDITFNSYINLKDKIIFNIDLIGIGERYAKSSEPTLQEIKLDPILDLNLGIEYKYSKILSVYLKLHNITSKKYMFWNQYPVQSFNLLVGFSYKI